MRIALITPGFSAHASDWAIPALLNLARSLAQTHELHIFSQRYPTRGLYQFDGLIHHASGGGQSFGLSSARIWLQTTQAIIRQHKQTPFDLLHAFWADEAGGQIGVAVVLSLASSLTGLLWSFHAGTPPEPSIVLTAGGVYVISLLAGPRRHSDQNHPPFVRAFNANARFCSTVKCPYSAKLWNTKATFRRSGDTPARSSPPRQTPPAVGCSSPATSRSSVVLPEPLGPTTATNSPGWTSKSSPSSAFIESP